MQFTNIYQKGESMNSILTNESQKRDQLFSLINSFIDDALTRFDCENNGLEIFSEVYEGVAQIKNKKGDVLSLDLLDRLTPAPMKVTEDIAKLFNLNDQIYVILGHYWGYWWPIDLISIASAMEIKGEDNLNHIHFSMNPLALKINNGPDQGNDEDV